MVVAEPAQRGAASDGGSATEHTLHAAEHVLGRWPLLRVDREHPLDERDELLRVRPVARVLGAADDAQVRAVDYGLLVILEGALKGRVVEGHRVQRRAEREDVGALVDGRVARHVEELGRSVRHRAVLRGVLLQQQRLLSVGDPLARDRRRAEVHEHRHVARAEQHVGRLDVAVRPRRRVRVELQDALQDALEDAQAVLLGHVRARLQVHQPAVEQRAALVQRHEQPELLGTVGGGHHAAVDELEEVRVLEGLVHLDLPPCGLARLRQLRDQLLQRVLGLAILDQVHEREAALGEHLDDLAVALVHLHGGGGAVHRAAQRGQPGVQAGDQVGEQR
eukprot:CAMPEP_0118811030 /NCGR_PEP_ID=MMETSP1162-20130426/1385_1 /TAXON_ID=33656 /ORGANISM="Phaeocystis Sp, Strain CCMP2710" /LENGTH=334 /DNA_ID=CAMNT_0006740629 /DNA_START=240 /DNA_END=1244 /DNA_ORIENTATION=-